MNCIMFDIETLGVESTAVVLSIGLIPFEFKNNFSYQDLIDRSYFVKFKAMDQVDNYKRTISAETVNWWKTQSPQSIRKSFLPNQELDMNALVGVDLVFEHIAELKKRYGVKSFTWWQRGSLDQVVFDSLCRAVGKQPITMYNNWMDVRTFVSCSKETADKGYCQIDDDAFDRRLVLKHDPVQDCALDIMMMVKGK